MGQFKGTGITNLVRHANKTYYLQAKIDGKKVRRSLRTKDKAIAREKLPEALRKEKARSARAVGLVPMQGATAAKEGTWGAVLNDWLEAQRRRPELQARTIEYYTQEVGFLLEDFPAGERVDRMTVRRAELWWGDLADRRSATLANNLLLAVRNSLELARKAGVAIEDVFAGCRRVRIPPTELVVPSNGELEEILVSVRSSGGRFCDESADLLEFLAFVGCRIGEAREVTWGDVGDGEILIRGAKDRRGKARTKGGDFRKVPMADRVSRLLERRRGDAKFPRSQKVFWVKSPKGGLNGATKRLGLRHLRVHDLRHFFATHCIERGIDIPTVAGWLGHKDGGVLAMKRYGHVRNEHSKKMAKLIG